VIICTPFDTLAAIVPSPRPDERIEGRFISPGGEVVRSFFPSIGGLLATAARHDGRRNCYYAPVLRRGMVGTKAGATRSRVVWADLDFKCWPDAPDPLRTVLAAVEAFPARPSILVYSGGGVQPYWLFGESVDVRVDALRAQVEQLNAALARAVCGPDRRPDHVQDVARVLRIPGTLNLKYGQPRRAGVLWCEPERRYELAELEALIETLYPWAWRNPTPRLHRAPVRLARMSAMSPTDLRERAAQGRIRRETLALLDNTGAAWYQSASEADEALACGLVGAGLTVDETLTLLLGSARGRDALERKGPRHGEDYLERTVAHAASYVGAVIQRPDGRRGRCLPPVRRPVGVRLSAVRRPA
jgi:hypothetical protein